MELSISPYSIGQQPQMYNFGGQPTQETDEEKKRREALEHSKFSFNVSPTTPVVPQAPLEPTALKPVNPNEATPNIPEPGQGVQVAGPVQLPPPPSNIPAPVQRTATVPAPTVQAAPTPSPLSSGIQQFQTNQNDIGKLIQMRDDSNLPEYLRQRSGDRAYELMNNQYQQNQAKAKVTDLINSNDTVAMGRILTSTPKNDEGSWMKMLLLGFISPQMAGAEATKLGLSPTSWHTSTYTDSEGNLHSAEIQTRSDGKVLKGQSMDGTPLTSDQLELAASGIGPNTKSFQLPEVHGTPVQRTNANGQVETGLMMYDPQSRTSYVQVGNRRQNTTGWTTMAQTPQSVYGAAGAKAQGRQAAETNAQQPAMPPMAGQPMPQQAGQPMPQQAGQPMPPPAVQNLPPPPPTPAQAARPVAGAGQPPVQQPGEPYSSYKARLSAYNEAVKARINTEQQVESAGRREIAAKSGEQVAQAGQVADTISNLQHAIELLDSGVHNIKPYGPSIQAIEKLKPGEVPQAVTNTNSIMDMVRQVGGMASQTAIKGHLTNQELTFMTENKPDGTNPEYTRQWLNKAITTLQRAQAQSQAQVNKKGQASNPVTENTQPVKTPKQLALEELARRGITQ
jgi:hypothetical protein